MNKLPLPRLLLIFDLNGTLLHRIQKPHEKRTVKAHPNNPSASLISFPCRGTSAFVRPHARQVLQKLFLMDQVRVAVWTSAHMENAVPLCRWLFQNNFDKLEFLLDRSFCDNAPMGTRSKSVIKSLDKIWNDQRYNPKGIWNETNTVIIDDSPHKLLYTPANRYPIAEFTVLDALVDPSKDDCLLMLLDWVTHALSYNQDKPTDFRELIYHV